MKCYEVVLDEATVIPEDRLVQTTRGLFDKWVRTTGHRPDATDRTWACRLPTAVEHAMSA